MPYEVILQDAGPGTNQIIHYVQSYTGCSPEKALQLLENLPFTIKTTNSKMEAYLIKEAIRSFGATVEIQQTDASGMPASRYKNTSDYSLSNDDIYSDEQEAEFYGKGPVNMWPEHDRVSGDITSPVKSHSGCLGIILAGFLLLITGIILASSLIA